MKFHNEKESLQFNILGYEFPMMKSSENEFNHDANWLVLQTIHKNEMNTEKIYINPCIETIDLLRLYTALCEIKNGSRTIYESDFLEPYLKFIITCENNIISITVIFKEFTIKESETIIIKQFFEKEKSDFLIYELKDLCDKYKVR